ncbi:557_t:CDS:1, partial [Entrophospora sp. SA101]
MAQRHNNGDLPLINLSERHDPPRTLAIIQASFKDNFNRIEN